MTLILPLTLFIIPSCSCSCNVLVVYSGDGLEPGANTLLLHVLLVLQYCLEEFAPGLASAARSLSQPAQRCLTAGSHAYTAAPHISLRSHPQALPPVDVQAAKLPGQLSACHVVANLGGGGRVRAWGVVVAPSPARGRPGGRRDREARHGAPPPAGRRGKQSRRGPPQASRQEDRTDGPPSAERRFVFQYTTNLLFRV